MTSTNRPHFAGDPMILEDIPGYGVTRAAGTTVPSDGASGYAPSCQFHHLDGATGTTIYVNNGTKDSANFDPGDPSAGLIVDAGGFTAQTTIEGALQELYQHLFSVQGGCIPLFLPKFLEVDANGDVGAITANGGVLASDTTPLLRGDTNEAMEIVWAAGNADPVAIALGLPPDFDGTADCKVDLFVKGGTTNAPSFTVETSWDGAAKVSDTATGSASASLHTATATIAAADVPDTPSTLTIGLTPGTHASDAFSLLGARLCYKRKLLTA